jgi:hypothetical protein
MGISSNTLSALHSVAESTEFLIYGTQQRNEIYLSFNVNYVSSFDMGIKLPLLQHFGAAVTAYYKLRGQYRVL